MKSHIQNIIDYSDNNLSVKKRNLFEKKLMHNEKLHEKFSLFIQVNETMRGRLDYNEAIEDPNRKLVDSITTQMVSEYYENPDKFKKANEFITNSFNESKNYKLNKELEETRQEIINHHINNETQKWVDEWIEKESSPSTETKSRKEFIISSLNSDNSVSFKPKKSKYKNLSIRIIGLAAAAAIATMVLVKTLTPSNTPSSLYTEYYKPLNAYSTTTRNNTNVLDPFSNAISLYNQNKYTLALKTFTDLLKQEPNNLSYLFFSGISYIGLEDYKNASIYLSKVALENGDYKKEAMWYLSLAFLKIGEIEKASNLLKELSISNGYYQNQAQYLLAHLKKI